MVDIIDAYQILNRSVLEVAHSLVPLEQIDFEDKPTYVRLEEASVSIAEKRKHLSNTIVVAHDLEQYTNKFYSITLDSKDVVLVDYLIGHTMDEIDLTEFGDYLCDLEVYP